VIEPAGPDVVRPAVAADDPHAAPDQMVHHAEQVSGDGRIEAAEAVFELGHALALGRQLRFPQLRCRQYRVDEPTADRVTQFGESSPGQPDMCVAGQAQAEPKLRVVLEQGVRPGRAPPVGVGGPGCGWQAAAVDGGAAGRVGDHETVSEQLGEQLEVWRLSATRARAGELEKRLQELGSTHCAEVHPRSVIGR
jgi:hypothetical protein